MISTILASLFLNATYFMLRISPSGNIFPKPLSKEEEELLLQKLEQGDHDARNKLIEHNLRLVAHVIKKYYSTSVEQDDLLSIGTIGLIKAINSYKTGKGTKLSTYAARCIENEILMHFRSVKNTLNEVSLSEQIDQDKDGKPLSLVDVLSLQDDTLDNICKNETYESIYKALDKVLDTREKEIIYMRFGLCGTKAKTQREVAKIKNISRSYVSRLEKKALEELKYYLKVK